MARQSFLRVTNIDFIMETLPRRSSDSDISIKRNNHHNNNSTCCCHGGHHGCGCGCKGCLCRLAPFKDESNCEAYGGEGGRQGMPSPDIDLPDLASRLNSSTASVRTEDSRFMNNGSFNNSYEARGAFEGHHAASANMIGTGQQFEIADEDDDGGDAWHRFFSLDQSTSEDEDSSGMVIAGDMDDSTLALQGSDFNFSERSMLNSEYESLLTPPSTSQSQVLAGTGAFVEHHFVVRPLRLTAECRHSPHNLICARCV